MSSVVYIDGQNFLYKISEVLGKAGIITDQQEICAIDIPFIINSFFNDDKIEIRYYGVKKIRQQDEYDDEIAEKSIRFANSQRQIRSYLKKAGVLFCPVGKLKVRERDECKKCGAIGYKFQEKGVDVGLSVDIVKDVLTSGVGHVILLSSDTDIMPAIKVAKKAGARISYVGFQGNLTYACSRFAHETKEITLELAAEAYARAKR